MSDKKYIYAVWRRNRSTVSVKLTPNGSGNFTITKSNGSDISMKDYFGGNTYLYENALYPLIVLGKDTSSRFDAEIKINWWGIKWHSDSIKLAFARSLVEMNTENKPMFKPYWLLMRDPRRKERKKPGLRWARKSPQWSKR